MKKLIKANDILIDVSTQYDKSVKKSIEFFLGRMIDASEIKEFRENKCPANDKECINLFINDKGLFLRDLAIGKKFNEYYLGREFDGYISDTDFLVDKATLKKLANSKAIILFVMPKEEADFIITELKISNMKIIIAESIDEGLAKAKEELNNFVYYGNSSFDKALSEKEGIEFVDVKEKNIKDLL